MVAISLYRGNLHRVPDVPRRWLMPAPTISLKNFKILLERRARALARQQSAATSNPNPEEHDLKRDDSSDSEPPQLTKGEKQKGNESEEERTSKGEGLEEELKDDERLDGGDRSTKQPVDECDARSLGEKTLLDDDADPVEANGQLQEEKAEAPLVNPSSEATNKQDTSIDKEKRKNEVEEKLKILNARKHNLVQMLKQILNAEEELKRKSSTQGLAVRTAVPLQVDVSNESRSMTRYVSPRMGLEGNLGSDMGAAETDDVSNQNIHSMHLLRISSTSPSSDCPHRRPLHNAVPLPSRATLGVASGSPSRFAFNNQQGHPSNLPSVSISGTNYVASSPSPAASGGTSVFKESRLPSPWN